MTRLMAQNNGARNTVAMPILTHVTDDDLLARRHYIRQQIEAAMAKQ